MITGLSAAAASILVVQVVALVGKLAGAQHVTELMPGPLAMLTFIGVAGGTLAWVVGCHGARAPRRLLQRLVPAVLLLSFVPDVVLGVSGAAGWGAVATLICAHIAVFAVTMPLLATRLRAPGRCTAAAA